MNQKGHLRVQMVRRHPGWELVPGGQRGETRIVDDITQTPTAACDGAFLGVARFSP